MKILTSDDVNNRKIIIKKIIEYSGKFSEDSKKLEIAMSNEFTKMGKQSIISSLRLCGDIPESYGHDSSEEKQYSKYTDILLSESFRSIGMKTLVLEERSGSADVEVVSKNISMVADAKAFRLSRTAKNQKDFKIQAMDTWKKGKPYAMVVCPIHQIPTNSSQIYQQAIARNVCIFTYSHLAVLIAFSQSKGNIGNTACQELLFRILESIKTLNPAKSANNYWAAINDAMLRYDKMIENIWTIEKQASLEALVVAKENALEHLAKERERIMKLSHDDALQELMRINKIDSRVKVINSVTNSNLMDIQ